MVKGKRVKITVLLLQAAPQESLTSSEFERFLAERAAAADAVPSTTTSTPRHRRPNKDAEDASLFAL